MYSGFLKLLDLLYPPVCPFCGEVQAFGIRICDACREKLPIIKEPYCMKCGKPVSSEEQEYCRDCASRDYAYDQGRSLWLHVSPVPQAIYQFKFHNKRCYGEIFAGEMALQYGGWIREKGIEEIIPVPLHSSRMKARGFNQASLLAEYLSREFQIPVKNDVVYRIRRTKPQKQLDDRDREKNLKQAFGVSRQWKVPRNVLLVDDIYTTGSTIHRIARVLKKAGVEKVYFLTISIGQGL